MRTVLLTLLVNLALNSTGEIIVTYHGLSELLEQVLELAAAFSRGQKGLELFEDVLGRGALPLKCDVALLSTFLGPARRVVVRSGILTRAKGETRSRKT